MYICVCVHRWTKVFKLKKKYFLTLHYQFPEFNPHSFHGFFQKLSMYVPVSVYLYIHILTLHVIPHLYYVLEVSP